MPRTLRGAVGLLLPALLTTTLGAQNVTVGAGATGNNIFPFIGNTLGGAYVGRYQQLFSASAFSQAIFIDALQFYGSAILPASNLATGNYVISFSTTSASVTTLSSNFDANVGTPLSTFFSGVFGGSGLVITGSSPYLYNPTLGNLLMDVLVVSQTPGTGSLAYENPSTTMARAFSQNGLGSTFAVQQNGLETTFLARFATTAAPEPASLMLMATGLVAVYGMARRRRRAPNSA